MTAAHYQLFPALEPATEAALRASLELHGQIVPIVVDQHGNILDGHHRKRITAELGIDCPVHVRHVRDDEDANEVARTLNMDRRHLSLEDRRRMVEALRGDGHSLRAIAGALSVNEKTVRNDLSIADLSAMPDRIRTTDGRSYPARRPEPIPEEPDFDDDELAAIEEADHLAWEEERREVAEAAARQFEQRYGVAIEIVEEPELVVTLTEEAAESRRLPVAKPDLGDGVSHPARYSDELFPHFVNLLEGYDRVLDPFAGTGRIHRLREHGHVTVGNELEPEWARLHPDTVIGSALDLPFPDGSFDAICTSPTYGNRLADSHNAADPHLRRSYTHDLGRDLHDDNSGSLQWGEKYREFHRAAWVEACRVLRDEGLFVLNIKDHIRGGTWMDVAGWHVSFLVKLGLVVESIRPVVTGHLRQGANAELRVPAELVIALRKVW